MNTNKIKDIKMNEEEIKNNTVTFKDLEAGEQKTVSLEEFLGE